MLLSKADRLAGPAPKTQPQPTADPTPPPARVVVVGSVNMDLVVRTPHMPRPGETVIGSRFSYIPGGKGANQAVAAARLGAQVTMIARVGEDAFGRALVRRLKHEHVHTAHVSPTPRQPSGVAMICVDCDGENAITVVPGANALLSPDDVNALENTIARAQVMLLQLEVPLPTVRMAVEIAHRHGVRIVLDPAPAPRKGLPDELFEVNILTPNRSEAEAIADEPVHGVAEAKLVGAELVRRGAEHAVIKLGDDGAVIVGRDETVAHVPAFRVRVVDTTAAGDAFTAALAVASAEGMPITRAVRFACAAGGLAAQRFGAQRSMPRRDAVDRVLQRA